MQKQVSASRLSRHYKNQHHNLGKKLLYVIIFWLPTHILRRQIYLFGARNKFKMENRQTPIEQ
jgi:predicted DCC family thiol-disulfide oxidoreductase YuxK